MSTLAGEAYLVVEANSGRILLAQAASEKKPVASLTKVATAMVVLDWTKANQNRSGNGDGCAALGCQSGRLESNGPVSG